MEGAAIFYSTNKFHLPAGSLDDMSWWSNNLRPDHKSLVKEISITFGLEDLTAAALKEIESSIPVVTVEGIAQDCATAAQDRLTTI